MNDQNNSGYKFDLSGGLGLNLGTVNINHIADTRSITKTALYILLIWAGLTVGIELFKFLLTR
jgi:hypothetical protein